MRRYLTVHMVPGHHSVSNLVPDAEHAGPKVLTCRVQQQRDIFRACVLTCWGALLQLDVRGPRATGPVIEDKCGEVRPVRCSGAIAGCQGTATCCWQVDWLIRNGGRVLTDGVEMADMQARRPPVAPLRRCGARAIGRAVTCCGRSPSQAAR